MRENSGGLLLQACESLCERLQQSVGLTSFRIELHRPRPDTKLVISLRGPEQVLSADPRHAWMTPAGPSRLEVPLRHGGEVVAHVRIEDRRRAAYPEDAATTCERISSQFAALIGELLAARTA